LAYYRGVNDVFGISDILVEDLQYSLGNQVDVAEDLARILGESAS